MTSIKLPPTEIIYEEIGYLKEFINKEARQKKSLLICSLHLLESFCIKEDVMRIEKLGEIYWLNRPLGYTDIKHIKKAINEMGNFIPEQIIAIGGGSAIDLAKVLSIFLTYPFKNLVENEEIRQCIKTKAYSTQKATLPVIAIPTTAGTGAELTKWSTVWDEEEKKKYSVEMELIYPKKAIIIPELMCQLSKRLTLSTTLDAFAHALEAYWSRATHPIIRNMALKSMEILMMYLEMTLIDLENIEYRRKLCTASVLAGLAFSQTRTTASHSISYPLTLNHGVEHGFAVAMTLSSIYELNRGSFEEEEELERLFTQYGGLKSWLNSVAKKELKLSYWGISREMINDIAKESIAKGRMDNNPINLGVDDVNKLLIALL